MRKDLRFVLLTVGWAAATACNGCFGCQSPTDTPGSTLAKTCDDMAPLAQAQKLDVLLVIDNSNSMREEQEGVARNLVDFVGALRVAGGIAQDVRVGVITTTVYQHTLVNGVDFFADCASRGVYCTQSGKLQPVPDANPDGGGVLLGTGSERVLDSDDPKFVEKFARLVQQGVNGSGQETPFEALRIALVDEQAKPVSAGGNGGFLRDDARLLIVVLSDEDDCSEKFTRPSVVTIGNQSDVDYCGGANAMKLTPVADYHDIFAGIKNTNGKTKEIIYTSIAPVGLTTKAAMPVIDNTVAPPALRNIDCATSNGAGIRHRAMAESFYNDLSNLDSIRRPDYKDTLLNIANLAGVSQTIELQGVADPRQLQLIITRADGSEQVCTADNGGFTYEEPTTQNPSFHVLFGFMCKRRRDDLAFRVERLCIF